MIRRNLLMVVCLSLGCALAAACGFMVLNFVRLAEAQTFAEDFVREAVDQGSAMPVPTIAPTALQILTREKLTRLAERAHHVGPVAAMQASSCVVQTDAANLCGGQLLACIVQGVGSGGGFEADLAMCRGGDFAPYLLAGANWKFESLEAPPLSNHPNQPI